MSLHNSDSAKLYYDRQHRVDNPFNMVDVFA